MKIKHILSKIKPIVGMTMIVLGIACFIAFYQFVRELGVMQNRLFDKNRVIFMNRESQNLTIIELSLNYDRRQNNLTLSPRQSVSLYHNFEEKPLRLTAKWMNGENQINAECVINSPGPSCEYTALISRSELTCPTECFFIR